MAFTKKIRLLCEHYHLVTQCNCSNLPRSSSNIVKKNHDSTWHDQNFVTIFFWKVPNSAYLPSPMTNCKYFLEFKYTHPMGIIFDGIRFGWIFSLLKDLFYNVIYFKVQSGVKKISDFKNKDNVEPIQQLGYKKLIRNAKRIFKSSVTNSIQACCSILNDAMPLSFKKSKCP